MEQYRLQSLDNYRQTGKANFKEKTTTEIANAIKGTN